VRARPLCIHCFIFLERPRFYLILYQEARLQKLAKTNTLSNTIKYQYMNFNAHSAIVFSSGISAAGKNIVSDIPSFVF